MKINTKRGWYQTFPALVFNVADGGFKPALKTEKIHFYFVDIFSLLKIIC